MQYAHSLSRRLTLLWGLASAVALSACGGGSDSAATSPSSPAPAPPIAAPAPPTAPTPPPAPAPPTAPSPLALTTLDIDTTGQTIDRVDYVDATYTVTDVSGATLHSGPMEIRGRGNSTWGLDKKPYRVRLENATALLGMPDSRHWVLLANHADKTLLRNDIAFEVGRQLGMAWTPRSLDVQVRLNGRYDGVYQLTEHIRVASQRVDIDELHQAVTGGPEISGGYLLQIDELAVGAPHCFTTTVAQVTICGEEPEALDVLPAQRAYIAGYVQEAENALYGSGFASATSGYAAFIDVASAIQYFLASELLKNVDGNLRRSTYLFKPREGKLHFGPLWDFDLAIGNATYFGAPDPQGWYVRTAPWYTRLFEDPAFADRVAQTWRDMKSDGRLDALIGYVDQRAIELSQAQARNFERWPILDVNVFANVPMPAPNSHDAEVAYLRRFLVERVAWLDAQFATP